jgi:hypothetical protein
MGVKLGLSHYENNVLARILRAFESRVLKGISGSKKENVIVSCGKLPVFSGKHHDLYSWQSINTIIVSRIRRWMGHVTRMTECADEC